MIANAVVVYPPKPNADVLSKPAPAKDEVVNLNNNEFSFFS